MKEMPLEEIWTKCLSLVEKKVGERSYETWFRPIEPKQMKEDTLLLEVPNRFFREWIEDNYPALLNEVIEGITGRPVTIKYKIAEKESAEIKRSENRLEGRRQRLANKGIFLNPKYTFENFVTGQSNQFAHAAALAVAEAPGRTYNPFFVFGGVGLGKTHLINAIGNRIADKRNDINILYVPSEQFTNEVVSAVRHGKTDELKGKYRNIDLLLIDDVQFLENKTATQEELFHTLNALYEKQRQIVLSSDRPPKEIMNITERLRSRFSMGLIADIQPPEVELRMAIIQKKAEMERIRLSEEVVGFLAAKIKTNVRDMEGCLIRLGAQAALTGEPIDVGMIKKTLRDIISDDDKPLTIDQIQKTVADFFNIKMADMKSKRRTKEVAVPRQVAMFISKQLTASSLNDIGKNFGGKDHATVIYACRQVQEKREKDEEFGRRVETLLKKLKG